MVTKTYPFQVACQVRLNFRDSLKLLESINDLGAKLLYPAILSVYEVTQDTENRKRFLHALVTLFVRHNVIGKLENSRLETLVFSLAAQLRKTKDIDAAIEQMRKQAPSDEQFRSRFRTAEVTRQKTQRYILREIEYAMRKTKELKVETAERVHVEHIYPQNPPKKAVWSQHESVINRLGNLTLLDKKINQTIKNSDFSTKTLHYMDSDLVITKQLLSYQDWNLDNINKRQDEMSENAVKIWSFPSN